MVFARTKIVMEDNCFEEEPADVSISMIVPNPAKVYRKMYELFKSVFNIADSDIQEVDYTWGKTKNGGDKFAIKWWVHKDLDIFSYLFIKFALKGEGNEKTGNFSIDIGPLLRTEYPQDTVWQRSLFYEMMRTFWHRIFYHRKREEYAEECRHSTILFQRKIIEFANELKKRYSAEVVPKKEEKKELE